MHTNVCLIGSTRFEELFRKLEYDLSIRGYIVLSPLVYNQTGDNPGCGHEEKRILDFVQKEKIRQSDIVLVVDKDGYVGKSTRKQIEYSELLNKRVLYYSKDEINILK
ncbi:MAG: hypothetical protein HFE81_06490 [Bacilli bacterium]|nr:hypothetical protein [Bacilli bacterium]